MKKQIKLLAGISVLVAFSSCTRNAITGRSQLNLVPESEVQSMAFSQYKEFLSTNKVISPAGNRDAEMVKHVGNRLISAITNYYTEKGMSNELSGYNWEINLVNDKQVNAWCMPGGKIVVYSGLLAYTRNEDALAIVMGHEITHALAKHGNERMSQGLLQQMGGVALSVATANKPAETQSLFQTAYGVGTNIGVMLPFSRKNEFEADKFGLMFAALAGYNPREAIPFWKRMADASAGNKPPEFLSTHPSDEARIERLQAMMDETVKNYYHPSGKIMSKN